MVAVVGDTLSDVSVAAVTVSVAVSENPPKAALMLVLPGASEVASPVELIVATPSSLEVQVTLLERLLVLASV